MAYKCGLIFKIETDFMAKIKSDVLRHKQDRIPFVSSSSLVCFSKFLRTASPKKIFKAIRNILIDSSPLCNTNLTNCNFSFLVFALFTRRILSSSIDITPFFKKGVRIASMLIRSNSPGKLSKIFFLICSISAKRVEIL